MMTLLDTLKEQGYAISDYSVKVNEAEKALGIKFAADYRELLVHLGQFDIGNHEYTGVEFDNYLNIVVATQDERAFTYSSTKDMYVIEYLGFDGIVIWQNSRGEIFQTIPNNEVKPEKIYDSFQEYIETEILD